jgi:hypothetical protein
MSKNVKNKNNYMDDLNNWNEHMNSPGYYTGGNMPRFVHNPGKPKGLAILYFVLAGIFLAIGVIQLAIGISNYTATIILFLLTLLFMRIGYVYWKKNKDQR